MSPPAVRLSLFFCAAFLYSCATAPQPAPVGESERIQFNRTVGLELAHQLEPKLEFRRDEQVTHFLKSVTEEIIKSQASVKLPDVEIKLLRSNRASRLNRWQDFALPGGRLYLSIGTLKALKYQNEVAAAIALQLARLFHEQVLEYFRKLPGTGGLAMTSSNGVDVQLISEIKLKPESFDYFGAQGVFAFSEAQDIEAAQGAVDLMYSAGYDPRGLVTFWQMYQNHPRQSPYGGDELKKILSETRRAIARKSPLRNPIVRTEAFIAIHERIEKL